MVVGNTLQKPGVSEERRFTQTHRQTDTQTHTHTDTHRHTHAHTHTDTHFVGTRTTTLANDLRLGACCFRLVIFDNGPVLAVGFGLLLRSGADWV